MDHQDLGRYVKDFELDLYQNNRLNKIKMVGIPRLHLVLEKGPSTTSRRLGVVYCSLAFGQDRITFQPLVRLENG
jgi:hypothetical protein